MRETVRVFVAVEVSTEVRASAGDLIGRLSLAAADVKWVAPENMHLTLKFLGDVHLRETARICDAVAKATENVDPFVLEIGGVGAFPNVARPRTIWLGGGDGEEELVRLQHEIEKQLGKLGFRPEGRRFATHLTIGRVRRGGETAAKLGEIITNEDNFQAGKMPIAEVVVFSSRLEPTGPIYEPLGRAPLA